MSIGAYIEENGMANFELLANLKVASKLIVEARHCYEAMRAKQAKCIADIQRLSIKQLSDHKDILELIVDDPESSKLGALQKKVVSNWTPTKKKRKASTTTNDNNDDMSRDRSRLSLASNASDANTNTNQLVAVSSTVHNLRVI